MEAEGGREEGRVVPGTFHHRCPVVAGDSAGCGSDGLWGVPSYPLSSTLS